MYSWLPCGKEGLLVLVYFWGTGKQTHVCCGAITGHLGSPQPRLYFSLTESRYPSWEEEADDSGIVLRFESLIWQVATNLRVVIGLQTFPHLLAELHQSCLFSWSEPSPQKAFHAWILILNCQWSYSKQENYSIHQITQPMWSATGVCQGLRDLVWNGFLHFIFQKKSSKNEKQLPEPWQQ